MPFARDCLEPVRRFDRYNVVALVGQPRCVATAAGPDVEDGRWLRGQQIPQPVVNPLRGDALVAIRQRLGVSVVPSDLVGQCSIVPARAVRCRAATGCDDMVRPRPGKEARRAPGDGQAARRSLPL